MADASIHNTLVVISVLGKVIDRVELLGRYQGETDDAFLDRAIRTAEDILDASTFDPEEDSCAIWAADDTGSSHAVWERGSDGEDCRDPVEDGR
jgi:hypothetical protein